MLTKMDYELVQTDKEHYVVIIYRRGKVYACTFAGIPSEPDIKEAIKENAFRPYNQSIGIYTDI